MTRHDPHQPAALRRPVRAGLAALALLALPTGALAQSAKQIITQPARDVGLERTRIPALLEAASNHPYAKDGTQNCAALAGSIAALTGVLGPDFTGSPAANKRNLYAIGATTVVNSLIPFRGIVRQISGASAADKRKAAAVAAGVARRGFLRGLQAERHCPGAI